MHTACTPGVESAKPTPRATSSRLVYGSYQVVVVGGRPAQGARGDRLDRHDPEIALLGELEQRLRITAVRGVRPQLGADREHHRVEVVAAQGLQLSGWGVEPVPGDPCEVTTAVIAGLEDRLDGSAARVELFDVRHRVQLVEVEVLAAEQSERLVELRAHAVGVAAERLAGHEEVAAHRRHERTEQLLRPAVLGRDVEVVDTSAEGRVEGLLGDRRIGAPERGTTEDRHRGVVTGPSESPALHLRTVPRSLRSRSRRPRPGRPPTRRPSRRSAAGCRCPPRRTTCRPRRT